MKILFLTSRLPYPPHRGDKLKIFHLMRQLSRAHELTLLSFISDKSELASAGPLKELCREVHTVYRPFSRSLLGCLAAVPSPDPIQVGYFRSRTMRETLGRVLAEGNFDVIHTHLIRMAQYTRDLRGPVRVLDLTDAGSLYLDRFRRTVKNPLLKLLVWAELRRLKPYEGVIEAFDAALVCSPVDRRVLASAAPKARLDILYNGIDLETFTPGEGIHGDPDRIIYTGNLSYFPNTDGIRYFVRQVLPLIRREIPGVKLYIVGKDPPGNVRKLASENITVTGFVPDIRAEYLASTVAVAPVRFGAGTLNKVLEPLALGIPVVSTPIGVEGLPLEPGRHLMLADSPADFAAAVVAVLRDPELRRRLSVQGRDAVRSEYGWNVIAGTLENIYKDLLVG